LGEILKFPAKNSKILDHLACPIVVFTRMTTFFSSCIFNSTVFWAQSARWPHVIGNRAVKKRSPKIFGTHSHFRSGVAFPLCLGEVARERRENTFHTQVLVIHGAHWLRIWPFRPANIKSWRALNVLRRVGARAEMKIRCGAVEKMATQTRSRRH
jgi:hypothetical protein